MRKRYNFNGKVITLPYTYDEGGMTISTSSESYIYAHGGTDYVEPVHVPTLDEVKVNKIAEIDAYDTSEEVNGFYLNGNLVWLDKDTRVGLMNAIQIAKAMGQTTITTWFGLTNIVLPCDMAIAMLSQLEMYAMACYNVTAQHKAAVMAMESIDLVDAYDITAGYPPKIELNYE